MFILKCGSDAPASLLDFVIMHINPKFVASTVGLSGCVCSAVVVSCSLEVQHRKEIALCISMFVVFTQ